jgi:hypothetical protein
MKSYVHKEIYNEKCLTHYHSSITRRGRSKRKNDKSSRRFSISFIPFQEKLIPN